jgi:hypothetical protein
VELIKLEGNSKKAVNDDDGAGIIVSRSDSAICLWLSYELTCMVVPCFHIIGRLASPS